MDELIGGDEMWNTATALASGHSLIANNDGEFRPVAGLDVETY